MTKSNASALCETTLQAKWFVGCLSVSALFGCGSGPGRSGEVDTAQRRDALEVSGTVIGTEPPAAVQYTAGNYLSSASGDSTELVVFSDGGNIRGMRYDAQGQRLDLSNWLALGRGAGSEAYTDVAFGAGVYLAVYAGYDAAAPGIYATAVDENGTVLGPPALVHPNGGYAGVAFNGTDFTVAAYDADIHLSRVGVDGTPVPGSSVAVTESGVNNRPVITMGPNGIGLVVFEQATDGAERRVYAVRFDGSGELLDPGGFLISDATTSSVDVAVAAGTDGFLAVWTAGGSQVYGSFVELDGSVVQREVPLSRSTQTVGGSAVAFDGTNYLVAWADNTNGLVYGARVSSGGVLVDASDVELAGPSRAFQSWDIDLGWTGENYSLGFAGDGVFGGFFDTTLTPVGPENIELSVVPSPQGPPTVAWDGANYVVGYSDERDTGNFDYSFRSVRIGVDGAVQDPEGVAISEADAPAAGGRVASNGEVTLYGWQPAFSAEPYTRVRDAEGTLSAPVLLGTDITLTALASDGDGFVATIAPGGNSGTEATEVLGQSFDATGQAQGELFPIVAVTRPRGSLTRFGGEYLYAYSGQQQDGTVITGSAIRFDGSGAVTADYGPVVEGMLTAAVGTSDEWALYVWEDELEALWARLLHVEDGFGEAFPLVEGAQEGPPGIAWDGAEFVVVYADQRQAMWTVNIATSGAVTTPERLFDGDYGFITLTGGPPGQMLLSYLHWGEGSRTRRVESRLIGEGVNLIPPTEEAPEEEPVDAPTPPDDDAVVPSEGGDPPAAEPDAPAPVIGSDDPGTQVEEPEDATTDGESTSVDESGDGPAVDESGDAAVSATEEAPQATLLQGSDTGRTGDDGSCSMGGPAKQGRAAWAWLALGAAWLFRSRRRTNATRLEV